MLFLQCKFMYTILNIALYFVLYPVIYFTIVVQILIIELLHVYKEGPLQVSTMY